LQLGSRSDFVNIESFKFIATHIYLIFINPKKSNCIDNYDFFRTVISVKLDRLLNLTICLNFTTFKHNQNITNFCSMNCVDKMFHILYKKWRYTTNFSVDVYLFKILRWCSKHTDGTVYICIKILYIYIVQLIYKLKSTHEKLFIKSFILHICVAG